MCELDSGGSRGGARGPPPPSPTFTLFWVKKIAEGRKAGRASKTKKLTPSPPPLSAQGLDPPLKYAAKTDLKFV